MVLIDTLAKCVLCRHPVVAEVAEVPNTPTMLIPMGPASKGCYDTRVVSFHCSNHGCGISYKHPPGKPDAVVEILLDITKKKQERDKQVFTDFTKDLGIKVEEITRGDPAHLFDSEKK